VLSRRSTGQYRIAQVCPTCIGWGDNVRHMNAAGRQTALHEKHAKIAVHVTTIIDNAWVNVNPLAYNIRRMGSEKK
jgi:hypothetical protein